jgi:hypothetical protein
LAVVVVERRGQMNTPTHLFIISTIYQHPKLSNNNNNKTTTTTTQQKTKRENRRR